MCISIFDYGNYGWQSFNLIYYMFIFNKIVFLFYSGTPYTHAHWVSS